MSAVAWLERSGVKVELGEGGRVRLLGLDRLPDDAAARVLDYAKANKPQLVEELTPCRQVPWPVPEVGRVNRKTCRGRYLALWAIANAYGVKLALSPGGCLSPRLPAMMPPAAAQALHDGFAGLSGYIWQRVQHGRVAA